MVFAGVLIVLLVILWFLDVLVALVVFSRFHGGFGCGVYINLASTLLGPKINKNRATLAVYLVGSFWLKTTQAPTASLRAR